MKAVWSECLIHIPIKLGMGDRQTQSTWAKEEEENMSKTHIFPGFSLITAAVHDMNISSLMVLYITILNGQKLIKNIKVY